MKNSEYNMIIRVTDMDLVGALLTKAERLDLTISNDNETKTGIEHIQIGNSISVGTSDKFHINWARNIDYYAGRGIVPVYDIQLDWSKIVERLNQYAEAVEEEAKWLTDDASLEICVSEDEVVLYDECGDHVATLSREEVSSILESMDNL